MDASMLSGPRRYSPVMNLPPTGGFRGTGTGREPDFFSAQIVTARRFYLDLHPNLNKRISVVCAGNEHCTPDYHIHRSGFRYFSLEFVARGEGVVRLGRSAEAHAVSTGSVFVYGPRIAHDIQSSAKAPLVKYFVSLLGRSARKLLRAPAPGQLIQTSAPQEILSLLEDLISAGLRRTQYRQEICDVLTEHLLLRIAETAVPAGTLGTQAFDTYVRCREMIEGQYMQWQDLAQIAERCQVDEAYLCRLFGRFDHVSPWQYVIWLRMRQAAERLQTPGKRVRDVADELGFSDPFQFSRSFRKVFGVSPVQFMKR
jgi:AraC-like DNA-binding protein